MLFCVGFSIAASRGVDGEFFTAEKSVFCDFIYTLWNNNTGQIATICKGVTLNSGNSFRYTNAVKINTVFKSMVSNSMYILWNIYII